MSRKSGGLSFRFTSLARHLLLFTCLPAISTGSPLSFSNLVFPKAKLQILRLKSAPFPFSQSLYKENSIPTIAWAKILALLSLTYHTYLIHQQILLVLLWKCNQKSTHHPCFTAATSAHTTVIFYSLQESSCFTLAALLAAFHTTTRAVSPFSSYSLSQIMLVLCSKPPKITFSFIIKSLVLTMATKASCTSGTLQLLPLLFFLISPPTLSTLGKLVLSARFQNNTIPSAVVVTAASSRWSTLLPGVYLAHTLFFQALAQLSPCQRACPCLT